MANIFVRGTAGANANTGADWNNAKQTVAGALLIAANNDVILVDRLESFTATAVITWTPPAGNVAIISVDRSGTTGFTKTAGAIEAVGAATAAFTIAGAANSNMYVWGMTLSAGTTNASSAVFNLLATASISASLILDSCSISVPTISNATSVIFGLTGQAVGRSVFITLRNTTITFGSRVGSALNIGEAIVELIDCTLVYGALKPVQVFTIGATDVAVATVRDCDWSGIVSTPMVLVTNNLSGTFLFKNCKLPPSGSWTTGTWGYGAGNVTFRNCISTSYTALNEYYNFFGQHNVTTAQYITNADGAVYAGTPVSWNTGTNASANEFSPFVTQALEVWNDVTGSRTATVEISSLAAGPYTDRQIWMEASYDHNNTTIISNRNANPFTGTGTNHTTSTAPWQVSTVSKQQMQVTFTATQVGLLQIRIHIGIASLSNFHINPVIKLT